jgi:hypothetical protein
VGLMHFQRSPGGFRMQQKLKSLITLEIFGFEFDVCFCIISL